MTRTAPGARGRRIPTGRPVPSSPAVVAGWIALLLTAGLTGCQDRSEHESMLGTWQLDAETAAWVPRSCVVLDFEQARAPALDVEYHDGEYEVRLHDRLGSTFHGRVRSGVFDGQQLLPTSPTGRFCGSRTAVHLRLNLRGEEPGTLRGTWQTPECDVCPDRRFGAERVAL